MPNSSESRRCLETVPISCRGTLSSSRLRGQHVCNRAAGFGNETRIMWRLLLACMSILLSGIPSHAQSVIRLARITDIPDQYVGGEILRAVYGRLNITVAFEDVPGKRALALSSTGELDGEVHRI